MILADKIIRHRKLNGWSQEELAERTGVSRQAVSKWESAQSVPDLDKILKLSSLFGVSTDYLLKDEMETDSFTNFEEPSAARTVTMEEANNYLSLRKKAALRIAMATFICILSPICLFILTAAQELENVKIPKNAAILIGLIVLFLLVSAAVGIFIFTGFESSSYQFLENEPFETEYRVSGMVKEKYNAFYNTYVKMNIIGIILCIISPIALFIGAFTDNGFITVCMLSVMFLIAGIGVFLIIWAGVQNASMKRLLKDPEFATGGSSFNFKDKKPVMEAIARIYWLIATVIYLSWSFLSVDWDRTWIVWVIAGILYGVLMAVFNICYNEEDKANKK